MQVRRDGVASVSDEAEDLAAGDAISFVNPDAARLHMCVKGIAVLTKVEDDSVPVGLNEGDSGGIPAGRLLGLAVDGVNHGGVGDGEYRFAEDGVAVELFARSGVDAVLRIELLPVNGHALGDPDAPINGKRGAGVTGGVAAGVGGDITAALQWRANDDDRLAVDGEGASGLGDLLMAGRRCAGAGSDAMSELLWDRRTWRK